MVELEACIKEKSFDEDGKELCVDTFDIEGGSDDVDGIIAEVLGSGLSICSLSQEFEIKI